MLISYLQVIDSCWTHLSTAKSFGSRSERNLSGWDPLKRRMAKTWKTERNVPVVTLMASPCFITCLFVLFNVHNLFHFL